MRRQVREILIIGAAACALAACGQSPGQQNTTVGYGPNPTLPEPSRTLLPTVKIDLGGRRLVQRRQTARAGRLCGAALRDGA